ncbi:hypothetical protein [Bradyrhizobium sp. SYSU BS000235]|uniref:hypothetical protein n=1 Tax=Bradyrhizobium sp. SYSU BS000235 TaxID=3411332 RepID=UPI003C7103AD
MESFVSFAILFHLAAIIIAAVFLVTGIKNRAFSPWLVFFVGLIVHAGPSLFLLGTYSGAIGYIVAFIAAPLAGVGAILWIIVASCIALLIWSRDDRRE